MLYLFWRRRFFFGLVDLWFFFRREIAINQIFDDHSALEQRKQNECFSLEKAIQTKTINVFGAKIIEIIIKFCLFVCQSTLGYFVPEILTLFSFVFTLAVLCSLSTRPRHWKIKKWDTSLSICTLVSKCARD